MTASSQSDKRKVRQIPLTSEYNKLATGRGKNEFSQMQKYLLNNKAASSSFNLLGQTNDQLVQINKDLAELNLCKPLLTLR